MDTALDIGIQKKKQIANFQIVEMKGKMMNRNKYACTCKNVTYGMIIDAVEAGACSYEEVQERLKFGTGCGKCKDFIRVLVRDVINGER